MILSPQFAFKAEYNRLHEAKVSEVQIAPDNVLLRFARGFFLTRVFLSLPPRHSINKGIKKLL